VKIGVEVEVKIGVEVWMEMETNREIETEREGEREREREKEREIRELASYSFVTQMFLFRWRRGTLSAVCAKCGGHGYRARAQQHAAGTSGASLISQCSVFMSAMVT
jgi:hypothetical protein